MEEEPEIIEETIEVLKRLSPKNQAYFMTLVRVAEAAENGIKSAAIEELQKSLEQRSG